MEKGQKIMSDSNLENAEFYEDEFMGVPINEVIQEHSNICEIAERYETEGWWHIENGLTHEHNIEHIGLVGILAVIAASASSGNVKKSLIMEDLRLAAPKLSRTFRSELIDLLTGNNAHRHLLKKTYNNDYQLMSDLREPPTKSVTCTLPCQRSV